MKQELSFFLIYTIQYVLHGWHGRFPHESLVLATIAASLPVDCAYCWDNTLPYVFDISSHLCILCNYTRITTVLDLKIVEAILYYDCHVEMYHLTIVLLQHCLNGDEFRSESHCKTLTIKRFKTKDMGKHCAPSGSTMNSIKKTLINWVSLLFWTSDSLVGLVVSMSDYCSWSRGFDPRYFHKF